MINSLLLVDDEDLFHLIFEDACSLLGIALDLRALRSSDRADELFSEWRTDSRDRPECVFVDLNIIGSTYDGVELVRRINQIHGNGVVIGIISSSSDPGEIDRAKACGAQFWLVKTDDIEPRLEAFREDYEDYKTFSAEFKVYQ